jgi:hypothetical protein
VSDPIARLEAALARLGEDTAPPADWESRVLTTLAERSTGAAAWAPRRGRRCARSIDALGAVAVAAMIALVLWGRRPPVPSDLAIAVAWEPPATAVRTSAMMRGSTVHATATFRSPGDRRSHAIWVYRDHRELVAACADAAGPEAMSRQARSCEHSATRLDLAFQLASSGHYTVVAVATESPLYPGDGFDRDLAAAQRAGATTPSLSFDVK